MINAKPNKPKQKSRIATRAGYINNILLVMTLVLMTAVTAMIIHNINNNNAKNLAKAYSIEAAQMFHLHISHNLPLVRKASRSKAISNWFANEGNKAKRATAFDEMTDYAGLLQDEYLDFAINESKNEYTIDGGTAYEDFVPKGRLNPSNNSSAWYFECTDSENDYAIKIGTEKNTNIWRLWISHKITADGKFTGVLSSVHRIPDVFYSVFDKDDIDKFRGYIIDKYGAIRSDSAAYGIYSEEKTNRIREESSDPAFAEAFASYLGRINGIFSDFSEPEIIKLSKGRHYEYAGIHPISHTDWSVVVFYSGHALSGITNILPLMIVMLAALFLYVAGRTALMDRLVYIPLNRLTQSISEGKLTHADFYGSNRNDEIGELARAIRNATHEQRRQERLMHAVNGTAAVLFVATEVENIHTLLLDSMEIIGRCVGVDRIHIWRNETIDGIFCYVNQVQWVRERSQSIKLPAEKYSYSETLEWERKFSKNEYVNGPVSTLTRQEQDILTPLGVKSVLAIPLYIQGQFYGFCSFDNCQQEYTFTDDEIEILRSAGLIIISAINRNAQAAQLRKAHEYNKLMLDATPLGCHIWDKNFNIIDCNDEAVRLFNLKDKQEYLNRFFDLSPKYQPNGDLSSYTSTLYSKKAFEEGKYVFKWMYQTLDGSPLPAEVTLISIPYEDDFILIGYIEDLREHERMMNEIKKNDNLLYAVNSAAIVMLSTEEENFNVSLHKGMELMGHCVDVDRVQIWQDEIINDELHFSLKYEWISDYGRETDPVHANLKLPYNVMPEWKEKFSRGEYINRSFPELSTEEQEFFNHYNIKSIAIIPLFLQNQLWGFFCIADCRKDRTFTEDEIDILRSGSLMMISVMNRNMQAMLLRQAHERTRIILDAMPMSYQLWRRDGNMLDCNEEAVKLFKMKDKQDFMDRFLELSHKYQPDGQLSYEKAIFNLKKTLDEGRCVFEFMNRMSDGTPVPTEVTAVRVKLGDEDVVASYARDLREYEQMMQEIDRRDYLLNIVNNAATILLQSETEKFESDLNNCMGMIAEAVGVDRVYIWKNHTKDGQLYCTQMYEWSGGAIPMQGSDLTIDISYREIVPNWEKTLSQGNCINNLVRNMSISEQKHLSSQEILSIFVLPVFLRDQFWGFVGYDDCHKERIFSENEQLILSSGGMVIANAFLRNEMTQSIYATAAKLETVVANYTGIIWSVNRDHIITLYNGLLLRHWRKTQIIEGQKLETDKNLKQFSTIITNINKTFSDGAQDWIFEFEDKVFHARSTPIFDESGLVTDVMGSFDDITELITLQTELNEALKAAQEANNAKTIFLANMSHEMRTPLNAVIGLSELTMEADGLSEEIRKNLEKISNAGSTLLSTVNDILDISKIEAGKFELVQVEYDISSLINDAINQSIMRIEEKPIQFVLNIDENIPTHLYGDDLRIKQILNNLLTNAFKYTKEGRVELSISCAYEGLPPVGEEKGSVWLTAHVSDTGKGIRKEDLDRLFIDYTQVDILSNRKIEGTGLGLPITKRIVEMMDGAIYVESEYGKGSVFTVRIRQEFISDETIGAEVVENLKNFQYSNSKRKKNLRLTRIRLPYARVLVVDDVETNLDVVKGMMKPYGMQIDCVENGYDAVEAIRAEKVKYNAVFMDHMMPGMNGIEATKIIREEIGTEYAQNLPIIALTANAIVGNKEIFLSNGFQDFLSKPIEIARLDAVIRRWIRDKTLENEYLIENNDDIEEMTTIQSFPFRIDGADLQEALKRFSGDEESFLQVLHSYAANTPILLEAAKIITKENLSDYAIKVHGIKSSSRSINAEAIGDRAEALEKAAKEGNIDFVNANNATFIEVVERLISELNNMLKQKSLKKPKPKKDRPDKKVLDRLIAACVAYDMDGVDAAMTELELYEYESDGGLAVWLRENVDMMNFAEVIEKLSTINE